MARATSSGTTNRSDSRMGFYIPRYGNEFRDWWRGPVAFRILDCALPTWRTNELQLAQWCDRPGVVGARCLGGIGTTSPDPQRILDRFRPRLWQLRYLVQRLRRARPRKLVHRPCEVGWNRESEAAPWCGVHRLDEESERRHDHRGKPVTCRGLLSAARQRSVPECRPRTLEGRDQQLRKPQQRQHGPRIHARRRL